MAANCKFTDREKAELDERGYVLRRDVFDAAELRAIRNACEALVERLLAEKRRAKYSVGSYMFEVQRRLETIVKWEPDNPDLVQRLEPFAHLSASLQLSTLRPSTPARADRDVRIHVNK